MQTGSSFRHLAGRATARLALVLAALATAASAERFTFDSPDAWGGVTPLAGDVPGLQSLDIRFTQGQNNVHVLVVGPSGAGKDTLINAAKAELATDPRFVFPRRVVTRPAVASLEDHDSVTPTEFALQEANGAYALSWEAHGLQYGLPGSILDDIAAGRVVVMNSSRAMVGTARAKFPGTVVVLIGATLSFIGLAESGLAEWGVLVSSGQAGISAGRWWASTFPGLMVFLWALAFNLFGDGLRDVLDPRTSRR